MSRRIKGEDGEGKRNRREEKEGGEEGKRNRSKGGTNWVSKMSTSVSRTLQVCLGSLELTSTTFQRMEAG